LFIEVVEVAGVDGSLLIEVPGLGIILVNDGEVLRIDVQPSMIGGVDPVVNERSLGDAISFHELFVQRGYSDLQVSIVFAKVGNLTFEFSVFGGEAGDLSVETLYLIL
jgi:hypothetical protein